MVKGWKVEGGKVAKITLSLAKQAVHTWDSPFIFHVQSERFPAHLLNQEAIFRVKTKDCIYPTGMVSSPNGAARMAVLPPANKTVSSTTLCESRVELILSFAGSDRSAVESL